MLANKVTLEREVRFSGVGVHSGHEVEVRLEPSPEGAIIFQRTDLDDCRLSLDVENADARNCSFLNAPEGRVQTIEHLLAALYAFGVDSLVIRVDGDEIPAMDGSAQAFARSVFSAGLHPLSEKKQFIRVADTVSAEHGEGRVTISPDPGFRVSYSIEFDHPAIGFQELSLSVSEETFLNGIAPARTFGFLRDVEQMRKLGLARGGSLDNAIVLDDEGVINGPLRFPDEFVRHKILDLVGDLALLGHPILAHVRAHKAGHALHHKAIRALLEKRECFELVTLD